MEPTGNTLDFVLMVMRRFAQARIATWLAGGWAEELREMCAPRQHKDIDLLYVAPNFDSLDHWLSHVSDFSPIEGKRFWHKRAVLYNQIMIEVVLLEPHPEGYITHYFGQKYALIWPNDSLEMLSHRGSQIPTASCHALKLHRQVYPQIAQAYQTYLQEQRETA